MYHVGNTSPWGVCPNEPMVGQFSFHTPFPFAGRHPCTPPCSVEATNLHQYHSYLNAKSLVKYGVSQKVHLSFFRNILQKNLNEPLAYPIVAHCSQEYNKKKKNYIMTSNHGHSQIKSFTHKYSHTHNQKQTDRNFL